MWFDYYLCFVFLIKVVVFGENVKNGTISAEQRTQNTTVLIKPQPSRSQTQKVETLNDNLLNNTNKIPFKPSPQLDTYYEYNKHPVPPVVSEPKHIPYFSHIFAEEDDDKLIKKGERVKFPITPAFGKYFHTHDRPTAVNKAQFPEKEINFKQPPSISSLWYGNKGHFVQKTHYDNELMVKPHVDVGMKPWNKIIKFLTAIIPLGILISALTPTVITVTPMNDTQSRSRAVELNPKNVNDFLKCENRILCELLLNAIESNDGQQNVENVLKTNMKFDKKSKNADVIEKNI